MHIYIYLCVCACFFVYDTGIITYIYLFIYLNLLLLVTYTYTVRMHVCMCVCTYVCMYDTNKMCIYAYVYLHNIHTSELPQPTIENSMKPVKIEILHFHGAGPRAPNLRKLRLRREGGAVRPHKKMRKKSLKTIGVQAFGAYCGCRNILWS